VGGRKLGWWEEEGWGKWERCIGRNADISRWYSGYDQGT
jgi:hypothetical protein